MSEIANDSPTTDEECAAQARDLVDILNQAIRAAAINRQITIQLTPFEAAAASGSSTKFQQFYITIVKKL